MVQTSDTTRLENLEDIEDRIEALKAALACFKAGVAGSEEPTAWIMLISDVAKQKYYIEIDFNAKKLAGVIIEYTKQRIAGLTKLQEDLALLEKP